jgi:hypothetical protein
MTENPCVFGADTATSLQHGNSIAYARERGSLTVCPPARKRPSPASFCPPIALRFALGHGWQFEGESFLQLGPDAVDGAGSDRATRRERRDGLQKRRSQRWGNWAGELE